MKKAVIVDLDGTLCELKPGEHPIHTGEEKIKKDIKEAIEKEYYKKYDFDIIILTGRSYAKYYEITQNWIMNNGVLNDFLIMNMDGQPEKNHIFKEKALKILMQIYDLQMMYDDNPEVEKVCKKLKIPFTLVTNI